MSVGTITGVSVGCKGNGVLEGKGNGVFDGNGGKVGGIVLVGCRVFVGAVVGVFSLVGVLDGVTVSVGALVAVLVGTAVSVGAMVLVGTAVFVSVAGKGVIVDGAGCDSGSDSVGSFSLAEKHPTRMTTTNNRHSLIFMLILPNSVCSFANCILIEPLEYNRTF